MLVFGLHSSIFMGASEYTCIGVRAIRSTDSVGDTHLSPMVTLRDKATGKTFEIDGKEIEKLV